MGWRKKIDWINTSCGKSIWIINKMDHYDKVDDLLCVFEGRFVCTDIESQIWYEFRSHRWVKVESVEECPSIKEELTNFYSEKIMALAIGLADPVMRADRLNQIEQTITMIKKLNCGDIWKEYAYIVFDPHFLIKLDQNYNLICFENGVYDFDAKLFRDGKPTDYLSLSTGYKYIPHHPDDERVATINQMLSQIHPDPSMQKYQMRVFAQCLSAPINLLNILLGSGSNGKTTMLHLLKLVLGNYVKYINTPMMHVSTGIRACIILNNEPGLAGNVYTRGNYIKFIECNHFSSMPHLITHTIRVMPFETEVHGHIAIHDLKQIFMSMLITESNSIREDGGFPVPNKVTDMTNKYLIN